MQKGQMNWISLNKARLISGISKDRLKLMAKRGQIRGGIEPGLKVTRWRFDRQSIDDYFNNMLATKATAHERALVLLKGGRL